MTKQAGITTDLIAIGFSLFQIILLIHIFGLFHIAKPYISTWFHKYFNKTSFLLNISPPGNLSKQKAGGVPGSDKSSRSESNGRSKDSLGVRTQQRWQDLCTRAASFALALQK